MKKILLVALWFIHSWLPAQPWLEQAQSLTDSGDVMGSSTILRQYIHAHPDKLYDLSRAYFLLSYDLMVAGDYSGALEANDRSRQIREELLTGEEEENYMRAGAIYLAMGDYDRAIDFLLQAKRLPIDDPHIFSLLDGYLGSAYLELGQYEKAEHHYMQSLETLRVEMGDDHPDVAITFYNIGRLYWKLKDEEKARDYWDGALGKAIGADNFLLSGQLYNGYGEWFSRANPEFAAGFYDDAYSTLESHYGKRHRETIRTRINQARLFISIDSLDIARRYLDEAIRSEQGDMPAQAAPDRLLLATALQLRAALALRADNTAAFQQALEDSRAAIAAIESQLSVLLGNNTRLQLLQLSRQCYASGIESAMLLYEQSGDKQYADQAFELSERGKAFVLRADALALDALADSYPQLSSREKELLLQIRSWEAELAMLPQHEEGIRALANARRALQYFADSVRLAAPDYYRLRWNIQVAAPAQIQQSLDPETALLSYFIGDQNYYVFAFTHDDFKAERLPIDYVGFKKPKNAKILNLMAQAGPAPGTGAGTYSKYNLGGGLPDMTTAVTGFVEGVKKVNIDYCIFYGHNLYIKLIQPVISVLKKKKHLVFIPHDVLWQAPLEAILKNAPEESDDSKDKVGFDKLDYLVKDYTVQYYYAATAYQQHQKGAAPSSLNAFLGVAPVFDETAGTGYIWESRQFAFDSTYQSQENLRSTVTIDGRQFQALPYSAEEVTGIARQFAAGRQQSMAMIATEASEAEFKARTDKYRFLHLATHSFVYTANPALSGIAFAQPRQPDATEDGILYAAEIIKLKLPGNTVILSSCESGAGPLYAGEGLLSLSRAFIEAGAGNVIGTLWKVYDQPTATLMSAFYDDIIKGKSEAEALRAAKLKLIKNKQTAAPRLWSAFVQIGR
jgi:CHAT domain-containing protein